MGGVDDDIPGYKGQYCCRRDWDQISYWCLRDLKKCGIIDGFTKTTLKLVCI